ncbi:isoprenoid synthase domain-containing protein [Radiomyces spectabilis]|uniref:isoprenoid synthase domain-containing protein n=1 Tax=Radiomyces spectabilis TaxID=64574 RepID=UPI00221EE728|nr:isoprenoid synthase domain-containing protein [Radiomyces spectabilis]KAI8380951.1 isoprenoid synthase domain-containing protein [Radiomyces spectabilis]
MNCTRTIHRTIQSTIVARSYTKLPRYYSTTLEQTQSALKYCRDSVRQRDYDAYLCVPFYPAQLRNAQYAIRAFNVELASVRENVSKTEIGKMRMQFWKDTIDKVFAGRPPQQPIALALAEALKSCDLSSMWFKRIISERSENLDDHQFMTIKDMETYAENTASSLLYLQLESLGVRDVNADHTISHLGKMMGIATFLRALPFHLSQKRLILPAQVTAKHKLSQEDLFRGHVEGVDDAVFEVATAAYDQLLTARSLLKSVPPAAFPVLLHAVPSIKYLEALEKVDFNVFDTKLQRKDWKLPLTLWNAYRKQEI